MGVTPPAASRAQLEQAAEQTISAAAAALLWAGEDSYGVLSHVASVSAAAMAESRMAYAALAYVRDCLTTESQHNVDEELHGMMPRFEIAALPATAAPSWAASVSKARDEALRDGHAADYSDGRGIIMCHPDTTLQKRAQAGHVKSYALQACLMWGRNPLPLNLIEFYARVVSTHTAGSPAARFYSSSP